MKLEILTSTLEHRYKNFGKNFVSVEDVDKTLDELNEGESVTALTDQVEEDSARLDQVSPGACCMEFMEQRTKNILANGSEAHFTSCWRCATIATITSIWSSDSVLASCDLGIDQVHLLL